MGDKEKFGGDLIKLLDLSQNTIPQMVISISAANIASDSAVDASHDAFPARENRYGGEGSEVYMAWSALMETYQGCVAKTQDNLQDTARAVTGMVNDFISTDSYSADELNNAIDAYNKKAGPDQALDTVEKANDGQYSEPSFPDVEEPDTALPEPPMR